MEPELPRGALLSGCKSQDCRSTRHRTDLSNFLIRIRSKWLCSSFLIPQTSAFGTSIVLTSQQLGIRYFHVLSFTGLGCCPCACSYGPGLWGNGESHLVNERKKGT